MQQPCGSAATRSRLVVASAKRGKQGVDSRGGFEFSKRKGYYRFGYNEFETEVREDEAWKLAVPLLGGLVLSAALIGPLVIGIAFSAVAFGAVMSAGAVVTSLFLPFFIMFGVGALVFGGMTFGAVATLGVGLLLPKLVSLFVALAGLGVGAAAVSLFLKPASTASTASDDEGYGTTSKARGAAGGRGGSSKRAGGTIDVDAEEVDPPADPEVDRQLREFDELLNDREQQRRRTERFQQDRR